MTPTDTGPTAAAAADPKPDPKPATPSKRVSLVTTSSRLLHPATGERIPRKRLVTAAPSHADTLVKSGQARKLVKGEQAKLAAGGGAAPIDLAAPSAT